MNLVIRVPSKPILKSDVNNRRKTLWNHDSKSQGEKEVSGIMAVPNNIGTLSFRFNVPNTHACATIDSLEISLNPVIYVNRVRKRKR